MNRFNHYVLNGAIALLSTAGLVACSSSDDVTDAPVNPTYDGKSVKTQFAINVADNTPKNSTRMSGVNTQQTGYLSMANIYLLPIKTQGSQSIDANTEVLSLIPLNDPDKVTTTRSSHIYSDVNVPVGANNFLFYSTRRDLGTDMDNKFITGSITGTLIGAATVPAVDNTSDITFALEEILDATNNSSLTTVEGYFEAYLKSIKDVTNWSTQSNNDLQTLYAQFTNFDSEIRAGSAFAVLKLVSELYDKVKPISDNGTDPQKTIAQNIVNAIIATTGNVTVEVNSNKTAENPYSLKYSTSNTNITNFPAAQGLPEGAAQLTITSGEFKYKNQPSIGGGTMTDPTFNIYNLTYPAPITYFDNTPLKATDKEIQTGDWKTSASEWDSWDDWDNWGDEIMSTSRSVALKNNINYGVACFETTFKCSTAGTLEDNKAAIITGQANQTITVPTDGFPVTGILIGGQPESVNWQYISTSAVATDYENVVYDRHLTGIYAVRSGAPTSSNYTLVLDNYTAAPTGQPKVNVAVELVNTAEDFYGKDGLIAKGQKFYLIATLDPNQGTAIQWPSYDGSKPSFNLKDSYEGRYPVQNNRNRVFVQDFTTKADFTINTLKNAYVTLPDLRASLLQLGLSVDLKWQTGLTFDVPLGGTTN